MKIYDNSNNLLAIVIRNDDIRQGKNFVTDNGNEFQLAAFSLDKGEKINHTHSGEVYFRTVLYIKHRQTAAAVCRAHAPAPSQRPCCTFLDAAAATKVSWGHETG